MNDKLWEAQTSNPLEHPFAAKGIRPAKRPNLIFILADDTTMQVHLLRTQR